MMAIGKLYYYKCFLPKKILNPKFKKTWFSLFVLDSSQKNLIDCVKIPIEKSFMYLENKTYEFGKKYEKVMVEDLIGLILVSEKDWIILIEELKEEN